MTNGVHLPDENGHLWFDGECGNCGAYGGWGADAAMQAEANSECPTRAQARAALETEPICEGMGV